jgi:hypothetical protein
VTNQIIWKIRGQPIRSRPDSTKYKDGTTGLNVLTDDHDSFVASHLTHYERLADMACDGYVGYFSDRNIKKHTQAFFGYMVFLYDQIKASYTDDRKTPL